jgi:hypothetical protein
MPKYRVNLFYHGSADYQVEAADVEAAVAEARRVKELEPEEEFRERITLIFSSADVYEEKED